MVFNIFATALHCPSETQWQLTIEKARSYSFVCCTYRISKLFRNVLYCNSSLSQNEWINWIHHFRCAQHCEPAWPAFILDTILTFFKQFCLFSNIFWLKHVSSSYISHILLKISYSLHFSATQILLTDLCSSYKPITNNAEFTFMEKNSEKNFFYLFRKRYILYWMTLIYKSGEGRKKEKHFKNSVPTIYI